MSDTSNLWDAIYHLKRRISVLELAAAAADAKGDTGSLTGGSRSSPPGLDPRPLFPPSDADMAYAEAIRQAANRASLQIIKVENTSLNAGVTPALALAMQLRNYGHGNF